jgi:GTP-binding protein
LSALSDELSARSMSTASFTTEESETGRRLFAAEWRFLSAAASFESLPAMAGVEIAIAGRSNVGKSSLINALTNRNALARTSHTPGRTQELIFFTAGGPLTVVDMPGYGYAAAPKAKIAAWTSLIRAYLRGRANLARVYVLVDALAATGAGVTAAIRKRPAAYPDVLATSARNGAGMPELRAAVARLLAEKQGTARAR